MTETRKVRSVILFARVVLCGQAAHIAAIGCYVVLTADPADPGARTGSILWALFPWSLAAANVVAAVHMKQGRRGAAVSAVLLEIPWIVTARWTAAFLPAHSDLQYNLECAVIAGLSLAVIAGLSLRPVRSYFGWPRRRGFLPGR